MKRNVTDILKHLTQKLRGSPGRTSPGEAVSPDGLVKLMRDVERTRDVELSCDEVHRLIDQFAELTLRGENAAELMPLIQRHLDLCPDCREEFEGLMRVLRASPA
jgi:hypothetical protein